MDSIFNYIIFLIPLAIFIGRAFTEAKNRRNRQAQPVPIHFEDEDETEEIIRKAVPEAPRDEREEEEEDEFYSPSFSRTTEFNNRLNPTAMMPPSRRLTIPAPSIPLENTLSPHGPGELSASMASFDQNGSPPLSNIGARTRFAQPQPVYQETRTGPGIINLTKLSPLKQAVVMAEILGPPKALQEGQF